MGKRQKQRIIPATMATQHPDNAFPPFWEKKGDGFISVYEELEECVYCLRDLNVNEFMWDWEGKYTDEAVIDKLFSNHYQFFRKHHIGKDKYLTFRLPNVWQEKGYSLLRALMVILTSEDFARDLKFHSPPLFEVILPMTEKAHQLIYIQQCFQKLSVFKSENFNHQNKKNTPLIETIPLVEGTESQIEIGKLLREYVDLHEKNFGTRPAYIRPFLARSDPALISGLVATVLANKVALSEIYRFSEETKIPTYPIIGTGSLIFRGGLNPDNINNFIKEYAGIRTVTIQSAFRYDYPLSQVKKTLALLEKTLKTTKHREVSDKEHPLMLSIVKKSTALYQTTLLKLTKEMDTFFQAVPKRRERRQHIGLLSYGRKMGNHPLPRAINFTAAFYSLGVPPEFIGLGRTLKSLSYKELDVLSKHYVNLKSDLTTAGRYINYDNLKKLAASNKSWKLIQEDIELTSQILDLKLGPKSQNDFLHQNLTTSLLLQKNKKGVLGQLIVETGKLRKSLG